MCCQCSSNLEKCSIPSIADQWMLCSEWVPSEWVQTADNITIIHTSPVHQLTSWEAKSCKFARNKSIIVALFKPLLPAKIWISIQKFYLKLQVHNSTITLPPVEHYFSCFLSCQNLVTYLWRAVWTFFWLVRCLKRCFKRIVDLYFSWKQWFNIQNILIMDLFLQTLTFSLLKMLIDRLDWCGLIVDYCDVFISCLDSHSDGTHSLPLVIKLCNATFLQIWWRNKLIYMDGLRVSTFSANFP